MLTACPPVITRARFSSEPSAASLPPSLRGVRFLAHARNKLRNLTALRCLSTTRLAPAITAIAKAIQGAETAECEWKLSLNIFKPWCRMRIEK